jgi:hypothetical protein
MATYDPKRPKRTVPDEEPAPVDALIDLASQDRAAEAPAPARVVTAAPQRVQASAPAVEVTVTPDTPTVEGPHGDDATARVVLAAIAAGVLAAVGAAVVLRRRRRRR